MFKYEFVTFCGKKRRKKKLIKNWEIKKLLNYITEEFKINLKAF